MSHKVFRLWCNHQTYEFPLDTFKQVSKKCAALVKSKDYQGTINHPVSEEAFEAFSLACQLKDFQTTQTNAFELLDLAQEWGIKSLETFVTNYINAKELKRPEEGDHLAPLLMHLEDDNYDQINDVVGVSKNFDQYLLDDRLLELHPETIYQIYHHAETRGINQEYFAEFLMKLFESDPQKAVPLTLLTNFDRLTQDQIENIFQCSEMHEEFIGYFIAASMSTLNAKARRDLDEMEERHLKEIDDIREAIKNHRQESLDRIQDQFNLSIDELKALIEKQKGEIQELKDLKMRQQMKISDADKRFQKQALVIEKEIQKQRDLISAKQAVIRQRRRQIADELKNQFNAVRYEVGEQLREVEFNDQQRSSDVGCRYPPQAEELTAESQNLTDRGIVLTEKVQTYDKWVKTVVASFGAKIVHDQLRFDHFLRNTSRRFELFNVEPKLWDLDADQVRNAEEVVTRLEKKINTSCPISVRQQIEMSVNVMKQFASVFSGKQMD
ncbi:hypothetical protein TRFO_09800 [Tritrichomonas foetus]|uniref:Uncharacterized protein n=1 Tax=Tritrichomonas foetus TaxID=1144522 RepID=A0A1J4JHA9_9EUKA|nr:hypothetical protein TRFO_09800 [Tritrichomonas foetus]|eukprot:OHS96652.1 hypothetical protein TRFO_09800 [Tritrichomonas foetus]